MYVEFFGFREPPFNNTPDPRFFFSTPDHEEAVASLVYAVTERKGFVLLTGEVGAGKTLVTRMMLRHFGSRIAFANINHAVQTADDLMEAICTEFELEREPNTSVTQRVRSLHDFLLARFAQNIPVVLVLDEAQSLPISGFERLRMIGNLEADDAKLLQIAIVGQPELQHTFASAALRQLRQRVFRVFHIPALSRRATSAYIRHRLSVVSRRPTDIFQPSAFDAIHMISRGIPRMINTVCDNALLSAYSADRRTIDGAFIETVVTQMMLLRDTAESQAAGPEAPTLPHEPVPLQRVAGPSTALWPARAAGSPPGESSPGLIDSLIRRVAALEAQLPEPRCSGTGSRAASADSADLFVQAIRRELTLVKREMAARIEQDARRLEALERRVLGAADTMAAASATPAGLQPLVQHAKSIMARVKASTDELRQREERLRKLRDGVVDRSHPRHPQTAARHTPGGVRDGLVALRNLARKSRDDRTTADRRSFERPITTSSPETWRSPSS